jgi:hypothetical protein
MKAVLSIIFAVVLVTSQAKKVKSNKYFHPLSDEFINHINSMKSTWKVTYKLSVL